MKRVARVGCLGLLAGVFACTSQAAVSAEEAKQLGAALTPFGAEKAGNREGTIPPYTGGLPTSTRPAQFKPGSGRWADPYADEKPLYTVTAQNLARHTDKLSATSQALLQRNPGYRMDVYPTHRSVSYPDWVLDNTVKNATRARVTRDGVAVEGAYGGLPFPVPKNGNEVMWNHLLRYNGHGYELHMNNWYVGANGRAINTARLHITQRNSFYNPQGSEGEHKKAGGYYNQMAYDFMAPGQIAGNASLYMDTLDPVTQPRRAWSYNAATRRTRVAPDLAYDTPVASQGGVLTYDEVTLFDGAQDWFAFKLLGKREMLIPYNGYRVSFLTPSAALFTPGHLNPDHVRWELHRVWVVEATLKSGRSHNHARRLFYLDEDGTGAGMSDSYDASGRLVKGAFLTFTQLYDQQVPISLTHWGYDLGNGMYAVVAHMGDAGLGLTSRPQGFPHLLFTPDALPARSAQR